MPRLPLQRELVANARELLHGLRPLGGVQLDERRARRLGGGGVLGGGRLRGGVDVFGRCGVRRAQALDLELEEVDLLVQVVDVRRLDL